MNNRCFSVNLSELNRRALSSPRQNYEGRGENQVQNLADGLGYGMETKQTEDENVCDSLDAKYFKGKIKEIVLRTDMYTVGRRGRELETETWPMDCTRYTVGGSRRKAFVLRCLGKGMYR